MIYQHENKAERVFSDATAFLTTNMFTKIIASSTIFYNIKGNMGFSSDLAGKTELKTRLITGCGLYATVTLGSWIGYDNFYNARYAITGGDGYGEPTCVVNVNGRRLNESCMKRTLDWLVGSKCFATRLCISWSVVSTTGTKAGSFKGNGGYLIGGSMTADWFKKDFPPMNPRYDFMVGATPEEIKSILE